MPPRHDVHLTGSARSAPVAGEAGMDVGDIGTVLPADAPLTTEWRPDLLGGVMVIKGTFADGTPMIAIPNYARMNRQPRATRRTSASHTGPAPAAAAGGIGGVDERTSHLT